MSNLSRRLFGFVLAAGLAAAAVPLHAQSKEVRVGFQKYGTLVLIKSKGILEQKLAPLGYTVKWAEFAAGPQMLEALERRRHRHRPDRRGAADLRPGRRATGSSTSPTSRRRRTARRSSCRRTARSSPSPTSRARRSA